MAKTYSEKLLDPRWQRRRLEILSRADFHCESCSDGANTLHVHHKRYVKGREPWEYGDHELVALCKDCHSYDHEAKEMIELALASIPVMCLDMTEVASMIAGYVFEQSPWSEGTEDGERLLSIGNTWGYPLAFDEGRKACLAIRQRRNAAREAEGS